MHVARQLVECYHRGNVDNHTHGMRVDEDRVPAFAMYKIAFLASLHQLAVESDVSQPAVEGLRLVTQARAPVNHDLAVQ
ncbi:uncharacterized protein F5891DRAFT_1188867 [Suillus fuscotomentosus]|uniref:Uncharacterized protein n=1 Tax=Suillus fuscotomentosus TaxID=1912939 RepID=A0AAD4E831_9AGAM|nr:uncharacterized protein F5891DRAFT_1188867 [Suillus fuscotomentosus]KAG1900169.1 hypothetical protein F5891DRAFT_1188867 [Suillus fuscotomentosus]